MPHISSQKLNKTIYKKLFKQFVGITANLDTTSSEKLLSELLTETERIMLTKRLAAAIMLCEGYSQYAIEKTLKLSSSTVVRINAAYEAGEYAEITKLFRKKKKNREEFWGTLEVLLRLGMPSMGRERWKHVSN